MWLCTLWLVLPATLTVCIEPPTSPVIGSETRERVGEALRNTLSELPIEEEPAARINQLVKIARVRHFAGDRDRAKQELDLAEGLKKRISDPGEVWSVCLSLSGAASALGDHKRALIYADLAEQSAEKDAGDGDELTRFPTLNRLVKALIQANELERARQVLRGLARSLEKPKPEAKESAFEFNDIFLISIAGLYRDAGDLDEAEKLINRIVERIQSKKADKETPFDIELFSVLNPLATHGWTEPTIRLIESNDRKKFRFSLLQAALSACEEEPGPGAEKLLDWADTKLDGWKKAAIAENQEGDDFWFASGSIIESIARLGRPELAARWLSAFEGFRLALSGIDACGECALAFKRKGELEKGRKLLTDFQKRRGEVAFGGTTDHAGLAFWQARLGEADLARKTLDAAPQDEGAIPPAENPKKHDFERSNRIRSRLETAKAYAGLAQAYLSAKRDQDARQALAKARKTFDSAPNADDFGNFTRTVVTNELLSAYARAGQVKKAIELYKQNSTHRFSRPDLLGILPILVEAHDAEGIKDVLESLDREKLDLVASACLAYRKRPYSEMLGWVDHVRDPRERLELLALIVAQTLDPSERSTGDFLPIAPPVF